MNQNQEPQTTENNAALRHTLPQPQPETLAVLHRLEGLLEKITRVKPVSASSQAWDRFHQLPNDTQALVVHAWKEQALFIEGALEAGLNAYDEKGMFTYALSKLNLLGEAGLTDEIVNGDVVEIFNADFIQVYRSFSYFALCHYSLVELSAYPFYELYERASSVTKPLFDTAANIFNGSATRVSFRHIPEYTVRELMTEERRTYLISEKIGVRLVSPLTGEYFMVSTKTVRELQNDVSAGPSNLHFI